MAAKNGSRNFTSEIAFLTRALKECHASGRHPRVFPAGRLQDELVKLGRISLLIVDLCRTRKYAGGVRGPVMLACSGRPSRAVGR
jgi:hypothetical protein